LKQKYPFNSIPVKIEKFLNLFCRVNTIMIVANGLPLRFMKMNPANSSYVSDYS